MGWISIKGDSDLWSRHLEINWMPLRRLVRERPEAVVIAAGVFLRVLVYLTNRTMWLDEMSLATNLIGRPILDFSEPLSGDQLAPFLFLMVERALVQLLGDSNFALRLLPLAAGIAALALFAHLARRLLPRRAALVALVLFALSDDLIYYSSEVKPYAVDLVVGLAITLAACDALGRPASRGSVEVLAAAAALAPWCSFASAFVIAGCGATLWLDRLLARDLRSALIWLIVGMGWLAIFLVSVAGSRALLTPYTTMYRFWDFAFLPIQPPLSQDKLLKAGGILLELFVNPLNLVAPLWPRVAVLVPVLLLALGGVSRFQRSWPTGLLLVLPIVLALVASALKQYPLHGRLILELVPALFLLIAEGTEWLGRGDSRHLGLLYKAVLILLLAYPCLSAVYYASGVRQRPFNSHGDLHGNVFMD
ncbi:MAG TPA: glycosyltransferase family 39 protein [Isosphaeraceae bacterium]|nr:glycosyltransferase family 39 protein [Isosphaeraceae bacterium]